MTPQPNSPGLNHQQRRQQAKLQRRQGREKGRKPRPVMVNAMEVVAFRSSKLTLDERQHALKPAREGFRALREGVATYEQWDWLDTAIVIALAIEDLGVVRGLRGHLEAAREALREIRRRVEQEPGGAAWGHRTPLYFEEIAALREALHLHDFQLQQISVGELHKARDRAIDVIHAEARRHASPAAQDGRQPAQEKLL